MFTLKWDVFILTFNATCVCFASSLKRLLLSALLLCKTQFKICIRPGLKILDSVLTSLQTKLLIPKGYHISHREAKEFIWVEEVIKSSQSQNAKSLSVWKSKCAFGFEFTDAEKWCAAFASSYTISFCLRETTSIHHHPIAQTYNF